MEIFNTTLTFWSIIKIWFYCSWEGCVAPWVQVKDSIMAADKSWCLTTWWLVFAQKLDWILHERKPFLWVKAWLDYWPLDPKGPIANFLMFLSQSHTLTQGCLLHIRNRLNIINSYFAMFSRWRSHIISDNNNMENNNNISNNKTNAQTL